MSTHSHHGPLVAFTSLAIGGAGIVAAGGLMILAGRGHEPAVSGFGAGLLFVGLLASLAHLGRWTRFPLAGTRVGRSPLSTEVVLGTLALVTAVGAGVTGWFPSIAWAGLPWLSGALAAAFLVSIGMVYRLGGQLTWRGATVLTPLTAGLAFGVSAIEGFQRSPEVSGLAMVVLLVDAFVFRLRWRTITALAVDGRQGELEWYERRHELLLGRFLLLDAVPFALLAVSPSLMAPLVAASGLVLDRFGFYALGVQQTTEREIAAVERARDRTPPPHDR